jgi:23S rRNA (pseudouridine1915-N3)-methyltransferase
VLLTPEGKLRDSEALARWLGERMDRGDSLAFVLGSSHGFDPGLKGEVREQLSLSPLTFPHELSRVMLLEQLYRAFAILRGKEYHK